MYILHLPLTLLYAYRMVGSIMRLVRADCAELYSGSQSYVDLSLNPET